MAIPTLLRNLLSVMKPNRRRYDRRPVSGVIRLHVGPDSFDCHITDVSASGALVTGAPTAPIGTMVVLEITPAALSADARVVRHSSQGMGVAFSKDGVGAIFAGWVRGQSPPIDAGS
jgi:hypothetical protein